jgi:hypothetical protein
MKRLGLGVFTAVGILCMSLSSFANVTVVAADCSGSLFTMPGMNDGQRALVLTNGHCVGVGSFEGRFPADGERFLGHVVEGSVILRKTRDEGGERFTYRKILFASMTGTDLAVIELEASFKYLIDSGYVVYSLAPELPRLGMTLEFASYNRPVTSTCEVEQIVPVVKEGPWTWNSSVRLKAGPDCEFQSGQSGTAGTEPGSRLIYALAQTGYEGGPPCSFNNPCEVDPRTGVTTTGRVNQGYAVPTAVLFDCYDRAGATFNFDRGPCTLRGARK